jgi:tRNA-specific 2-thiouridylase
LYNDNQNIRARFFENVKSIAPGQSAVFYENDDVIGGGIIQRESAK